VLDLAYGLIDYTQTCISDPYTRRCVESELKGSPDEVLKACERREAHRSRLREGRRHDVEAAIRPVLEIRGSRVQDGRRCDEDDGLGPGIREGGKWSSSCPEAQSTRVIVPGCVGNAVGSFRGILRSMWDTIDTFSVISAIAHEVVRRRGAYILTRGDGRHIVLGLVGNQGAVEELVSG
jgi:hypothetical protein